MKGIPAAHLKRVKLSKLEAEHAAEVDEILAELVHMHDFSFSRTATLLTLVDASGKLNARRKNERELKQKIDALVVSAATEHLPVEERDIRYGRKPPQGRRPMRVMGRSAAQSEGPIDIIRREEPKVKSFMKALPPYAKKDAGRVWEKMRQKGEYSFSRLLKELVLDKEHMELKAGMFMEVVDKVTEKELGQGMDMLYVSAARDRSIFYDPYMVNVYYYGGKQVETMLKGLKGHKEYLIDFVLNGLGRGLPMVLERMREEDRLPALDALSGCASKAGGNCCIITCNLGEIGEYLSSVPKEWRLGTLQKLVAALEKEAGKKNPKLQGMLGTQEGIKDAMAAAA